MRTLGSPLVGTLCRHLRRRRAQVRLYLVVQRGNAQQGWSESSLLAHSDAFSVALRQKNLLIAVM